MLDLLEVQLTALPPLRQYCAAALYDAQSAAVDQGYRVLAHEDPNILLQDIESLTGKAWTRTNFHRDGILALRAVQGNRVVGSWSCLDAGVGSVRIVLDNQVARPGQPFEGLPDIVDEMSGRICVTAGLYISPSERRFAGLIRILRNAGAAMLMDLITPDYVVALVMSDQIRRGAGIHTLYGMSEVSVPFHWRNSNPDGTDAEVRLIWSSRLGALNFMSRVSHLDWGQ